MCWANIHLLFAKGKFYFLNNFLLFYGLYTESSSSEKRRAEEKLEDLLILLESVVLQMCLKLFLHYICNNLQKVNYDVLEKQPRFGS